MESDLESDGYSDEKGDLGPKKSRIKKNPLFKNNKKNKIEQRRRGKFA